MFGLFETFDITPYQERRVVMKNIAKTNFAVMAVLGAIAIIYSPPAQAWEATYTVNGTVTSYNGKPLANVALRCFIHTKNFLWDVPNGPTCYPHNQVTTTVTTDSNGEYSCSISYQGDNECMSQKPDVKVRVISSFNFEFTLPDKQLGDQNTHGTGVVNITNLPDIMSPSGQIYARRLSPMTAYPIVHLEGFDPPDAIKSGPDVIGAIRGMNYMDMIGATELNGTLPDGSEMNALAHVILNNYTFWMVMNGKSSGDSYRGTNDYPGYYHFTDGLIYQTMTVVKQISDLHKEGFGNQYQGLILGGFSGGALATRTGLLHWCNGYWADAGNYGPPGHANIDLPSGCYDVLGWYSGDGPLEGCMMPSSIQKFAYDPEFAEGQSELIQLREALYENVYSTEILRYTLPWYYEGYECNTGCDLKKNRSCSSTDWRNRCPFSSDRYDEFINWAYGGTQYKPLRNGNASDPLPAVAWSHGTYDPGSPADGGLKFTDENRQWLYIHNEIPSILIRDRRMYLHNNIGDNLYEHVNGSFFSQFAQMRDLVGTSNKDYANTPLSITFGLGALSNIFFPGVWSVLAPLFHWIDIPVYFVMRKHVDVAALPTYMPTTSSLATNTIGLNFWSDYNYQDENCAHIPGPITVKDAAGQDISFPVVDPDENGGFGQADIQMMFGFAHEQLKGTRSASPICVGVKDVSGKKAECRAPETEVCNCIDDDGDECVDGTMTANGCELLPNCNPRDFKVCQGVNNTCEASCKNRECGTDFCGGFCGFFSGGKCRKGQECIDGQCVIKQISCAADPNVENTCGMACYYNRYEYSSYGIPGECEENCILELCPGNGDDDGDIIYGAGIWEFDARSPEDDNFSSDLDRFPYLDENGEIPAGSCQTVAPACMQDSSTGGRDVAFVWRPNELRYRNVNMTIWPGKEDYLFVIREGDCSTGTDLICADCGPFGGSTPRQDNFHASAEEYCIIIDTWFSGDYGHIGQLRIWDAETAEICDNGVDDDGDGKIDCNDWKCHGAWACWVQGDCDTDGTNGTMCNPNMWVTAFEAEGDIWHACNWFGYCDWVNSHWRQYDNYNPSCGLDGGKDGVFVWYADRTGWWEFNTFESDYDTILWVTDGASFNSDTEIACNNDADGSQQSKVTIYAQKGEVYNIGVDANGPLDLTGTTFDVNATYLGPASGGGCYGGLNHSWEFCQLACPCLEGQGDCDSDDECAAGLICEQGHNRDYCVDDPASSYGGDVLSSSQPRRTQSRYDIYQRSEFDSSRLTPYKPFSNPPAPDMELDQRIILAEQICQSSQCEADFCNVECPCAEGEGDCDSDAECDVGLECGSDNGLEWGCGIYTDICVDPANPDGPLQVAGGGCAGDLSCGSDFCQPDCPCLEGQSECNSDSDCAGDLICQPDVGDFFGCAADKDVCTVDPAISGGGCLNAARCQGDFCDPSCPCNAGYGNCLKNADCASGLVCAPNVGEDYGCPANTNICVFPGIDGGGCNGDSQCDANFCSVECPCLDGQGNCDYDADCAVGLRCESNVGASYGCAASVNICVPGPRRCAPDYCSTTDRCGPGSGNCDSNAECEAGLICIPDVGTDYGCADPAVGICDVDPNVVNGGCHGGSQCDPGFCEWDCPCYEGQGQCDSDADCAYLLACEVDSNNDWGCGSLAMICMFPSSSNCDVDADCDDHLECTIDSCVSGRCLNQPDNSLCYDFQACTDNVCDPVNGDPLSGCTFIPVADDTPCLDGDLCNGSESCQAGECLPGPALDCDDNEYCTIDTCDVFLGCQNQAMSDGTACDDGLFCNGSDSCSAGICSHAGDPCSAGESCDEPTDSCLPPPPPSEQLLTLTHTGDSGGDWYDIHQAIDGSETSKAHKVTTGMEYIDFSLGGTYTLTRARVYEDNSTGGWELDSWNLLYWDGSAYVEAFPEQSSDNAGWNENDFADITTDRVRIQLWDNIHIEVYEIEIYGFLGDNSCGNGACDNGETCATCSSDCGSCCGNGACDNGETCDTCSSDCGSCCGNGACDFGETCVTCSPDCGSCCGNGACDNNETCATCAQDCGTCGGSEQLLTLTHTGDSGGDWYDIYQAIDGSETSKAHKVTTGMEYIDFSLDGTFTLTRARVYEDNSIYGWELDSWNLLYWDGSAYVEAFPEQSSDYFGWSENDFPDITTDRVRIQLWDNLHIEVFEIEVYGFLSGNSCGNGTCDSGETCSSCEQDCGICPTVCPNGICETGEDCSNCEADCGTCANCVVDADCDDYLSCTLDSCVNGQCQNQPDNLQCDDLEACTDDVCDPINGDPVSGCINTTLADGSPCPDIDLCNGDESCQAGICMPGTPLDCDDNEYCTIDSCDPDLGCQNQALSDGSACNDSLFCNGTDTCSGGVCSHAGDPCSAGETCNETTDSCDVGGGSEQLLTLTHTGDSGGDWYDIHQAIDGSTSTKAHIVTTGMEYIDFSLGGTYTLTRARVYEDNSIYGWELDSWNLLYWNGSAYVEAFPQQSSDNAGWNEYDFSDVTTDQIRIQLWDNLHIEVYEIEVYGF
jgi:hypothetical protein